MCILLFISFVFIVDVVHLRMLCHASRKFYFGRCNSVFSCAFIFYHSSLTQTSLKLGIMKFCCRVFLEFWQFKKSFYLNTWEIAYQNMEVI